MRVRHFLLLVLSIFLFANSSFAGDGKKLTRGEYIDMWKDEAIYQMVVHGIPASITLAQGILESADGNSELAKTANNHFGIKCHSDWTGKKAYHDDDRRGECFRHYSSASESFLDHSIFLKKKRYESLFELKISDYKGWAKGLKKCGYATNGQYAQLLIRIIEENDLHRYDDEGLRYIKKGETPGNRKSDDLLAQNRSDGSDSKGSSRKNKNSKGLPKEINVGDSRQEFLSDNDIRFIIAEGGESVDQIAEEMDMMSWQLPKYNDLGNRNAFEEGERIYLQPKRSRSRSHKSHNVQEGESLWDISQMYGVKIKKLLRKNDNLENGTLKAGMVIKLR